MLTRLSFISHKGLSAVVWNIYHYYKQFSSNVDEHIQKSKSPIEKDLKVCTIFVPISQECLVVLDVNCVVDNLASLF